MQTQHVVRQKKSSGGLLIGLLFLLMLTAACSDPISVNDEIEQEEAAHLNRTTEADEQPLQSRDYHCFRFTRDYACDAEGL